MNIRNFSFYRDKWVAFVLLICVSFFPISLDAEEEISSVISLLNGRNLNGWVIENGGRFDVREGHLYVDRGSGWLRSKEKFADYTLKVEFRFLEENANSGIFVRTAATSHDDDNGWPDNGYQVQCMDTVGGAYPLATLIPYGAPPFEHQSDMEALKSAYRPTGEWQTMEIECRGESMRVKLNGVLVTSASNIKNLEGYIGIQGEFGLLEFRTIDVVPL